MTRRITRTLGQLGAFIVLVVILVYLADSRFRVLPNSIHQAFPSHHAGSVITDVQITVCSTANPFSTCRLDPEKWHRIEKDLYLHAGWLKSAWLHVQRKKEEELTTDDKVIVGIRISRLDPGVSEKGQQAERWESRSGGIWILRSSKRHDSDSDKAVTAVDVLFGADAIDPRPSWSLAQTPLLIETKPDGHVPRLSFRQGRPKTEHKEIVPRVGKDGRFKILQVSDAHLSTGTGVCRDAIDASGNPIPNCEADPRTLDFVETVLDDEKPDLVVLTGDQIEGPLAPDSQSAIFKIAAPLIERSIPYAAIFGNHDDEGALSLSRTAQMGLMQTLPFSLSQLGPESVDGVGNYYVEVLGHGPSQPSAITLYMLDTHGLSPDEKHYPGYDWLKQSQIDWFRSTAQGLKKAHAKYNRIHMNLAFIHIPLPEYAEGGLIVAAGNSTEGVTAPGFNSHFYDALAEEGVVAVGCGHDHVNDYCALRPLQQQTEGTQAASLIADAIKGTPRAETTSEGRQQSHSNKDKPHLGPWMCYAGGSGFGGYGGYGGYHRRVRVWEFDTNAGRIVTWKRVECCGEETRRKIGELVIVDGGVVVAPAGE